VNVDPFGARLERRFAGLQAPVASLDVHEDLVVSTLQRPTQHTPGRPPPPPIVFPGAVCLHDAESLEPAVLATPPGRIGQPRFSDDGQRLVVSSWPSFGSRISAVDVWAVQGRRSIARRVFDKETAVFDAAPCERGICLGLLEHFLGRSSNGDRPSRKLVLWSNDLTHEIDTLFADDAGAWVEARGNMIAATGIYAHLWWPGEPRSVFAVQESRNALGVEAGPGSLSRDGTRLALVVDGRGDLQGVVTDLRSLGGPWVTICDGPFSKPLGSRGSRSRIQAEHVSLNDDGTLVAVGYGNGWPLVRIHRTDTAAIVASIDVPGQRAMVWLDRSRLLVGGDDLSVWEMS
jgi:hypothetical protein